MQLKPEVKPGDEQTDNLKTKREEQEAIAHMLGREDRPDFLRDGVDTLPAYRGPMVKPIGRKVGAGSKKRAMVYKVIALMFLAAFIFLVYLGVRYLLSASGDDITDQLKLSEAEISKNLGIEFSDSTADLNKVPRYTNGNVTLRSGEDLNLVYVNGKMVGANTSSRKYKFFGIGINEPAYNVDKKTTFEYDDTMSVINDMFEGNTEATFYRNFKTNECFVIVVSKQSNRVIGVTYYTNMRKMTENLSSLYETNENAQD